MNDGDKTKSQLIKELARLRQRIAELEAIDTDHVEKNAHGRRLLLALGQAAQAVQRARSPEAVYRAIGEQATKLGLDVTVFTLSEDREHLIVSYLTLRSDLMRLAEKLTGLSAENYRFPLIPDGFFQRVIANGETVLGDIDTVHIAEALPRSVHPLAKRLVSLLGWRQTIYAPLIIAGEALGLLAVTGTDLTESAVPAVTAFANQAAVALENAWLYKETEQLATFNESIWLNCSPCHLPKGCGMRSRLWQRVLRQRVLRQRVLLGISLRLSRVL